nr:hypothetical protein [uncultured Oscillibacter sp.]
MRPAKHLLRQGAASLLAAVLLCTAVLAAEPEKTEAECRREDLEFLYQTVLVENHPNAFASTPESEFLALKQEIESRLETESGTNFLLDLMRLTALTGDSHTMISVGSAADFRIYPFAVVRRGESWYLSAVPSKDEKLLCQEVTKLAGKPVPEVIGAFGTLFSSDNPVRLQRQFRQSCNVADIYEYLGLVEAGAPLAVTLKNGKILTLEPIAPADMNQTETARLADRITQSPATAAADAYYFAKPLNPKTYYIQYNTCREAEDLSMEDFAALVRADLDAGSYGRVLLDLRNNGGGSDGVIWPLLEVLREEMDAGTELVGLIGEATFSSALINAVEIQEMGGVLAGESAGGSVCHFGAVQGFSLPNSGVRGQLSSKYIDLNTLLDAGAGRGVEALEPDVSIPQTLADTLAGKDTAVEWLLAHPKRLEQKAYPGAPLTRGRFVGQLYEAVGGSAAAAESLPFADSFGIEWFLPALTWAKEAGIARGAADGAFSASRSLTWQEAAVFLTRAAGEDRAPDPAAGRRGPLPAALAEGGHLAAVTRAWDLGLLPAQADFTKAPTRAQGMEMTEALSALH